MYNNESHKKYLSYAPGLFFLIIMSGAILIAAQYGKDAESWASFVLSSFGSFLSGIATLGLLILAFSQIPFELEKFRLQAEEQARLERERQDHQAQIERTLRLSEKQELAAAEALEAVYRMINAIKHISNSFSYEGEGSTEETIEQKKKAEGHEKSKLISQLFLDMFNSRLRAAEADVKFFSNATIKARVFLDDKIVKIIDEIGMEFRKLRTQATMHSLGLSAQHEDRKVEAYKRAYENFYDVNEEREKLLESKRKELEALVRNYIHPSIRDLTD